MLLGGFLLCLNISAPSSLSPWPSPSWSTGPHPSGSYRPYSISIVSVLTHPVHSRLWDPPGERGGPHTLWGFPEGKLNAVSTSSPVSWHSFHMPQAPAAAGERGVSLQREKKTLLDKVCLKSRLLPSFTAVGFVGGQENREFPCPCQTESRASGCNSVGRCMQGPAFNTQCQGEKKRGDGEMA